MPLLSKKQTKYGYAVKKRDKKRLGVNPRPAAIETPGTGPKKRSSHRNLFNTLFFVGILAILSLVFYGVVHLQFFTVERVKIEGIPASEAMVHDLDALKGRNMIFLRTDDITKQLAKKYPQAEHLSITRQFPSTLVVSVDKRQAVAVLIAVPPPQLISVPVATDSATLSVSSTASAKIETAINTQYYVDQSGVPFATIEQSDPMYTVNPATTSAQLQVLSFPTLFYVTPGKVTLGKNLSDNFVRTALQIVQAEANMPFQIKEFDNFNNLTATGEQAGDTSFEGRTNDGIIIVFSSQKPALDQVNALQIIFTSSKIDKGKARRIDVRFNKPTIVNK